VSGFGDFVYAIVNHYKDNITYFEIWNEPNWHAFWNDTEATYQNGEFVRGAGISKYATLLKAAYTRAKTADPDCKIISGGIGNDNYYLSTLYSYGVKGYFDILGSHPYFGNSPTKNYDVDYINPSGDIWDFPKIQYMRDVMVANGDGAKPILITELGINYGDNGPEGPTTEEIQADRLARIFEKTLQEYPWVQGIMWYKLRDTATVGYGLFKSDYTTRLMYYAYKNILHNLYTVYQSGSNYYVKNSNESIVYQSTNAGDVINYAISASSDGGRILLQSGSYPISSQIADHNKNYVTFEGEGWDSEIIVTGPSHGFVIEDQNGWLFKNFKIRGTKSMKGQPGFESAHFWIANSSDMTFDHIWSQTANGYSWKPSDIVDPTYDDNIKIINSFSDDPGHNPISAAAMRNSLIKNNTFIKNDSGLDMELIWIGGDLIQGVKMYSTNNEVSDNILTGGSIAISLDAYRSKDLNTVSDNLITRNVINGSIQYGWDGTLPTTRMYIHGNNNTISFNQIDDYVNRSSFVVSFNTETGDTPAINVGNKLVNNTIRHQASVAIGAWNVQVLGADIYGNRVYGTPQGSSSIFVNTATSDYINCTNNVVRRIISIAGNSHGVVTNNTENAPD
jgi:hypothetical protein